jgi:hypothetical protein
MEGGDVLDILIQSVLGFGMSPFVEWLSTLPI